MNEQRFASLEACFEDMPTHAVRAASAQVSSAVTDQADRPGAFRHAEAPASVAAESVVVEESVVVGERVVAVAGVAAVAGFVDRSFVMFLV